jgi:hypothetical protein
MINFRIFTQVINAKGGYPKKKKNPHPLSLALPLLLRSIFRSPAYLKVWRVAVQSRILIQALFATASLAFLSAIDRLYRVFFKY